MDSFTYPQYPRNLVAGLNVIDPFPDRQQPILLLHGLGSEGRSWQLQVDALAQSGFRPLAPDLPGFGQSPNLIGRWSLKGVVDRLAELISDITEIPIPVVGISMGGALALLLAIESSERVSCMVLVNTFARLRPRKISNTLYLGARFLRVQARGPAAQAKMVAARLFPEPDQAPLRTLLVDQILNSDPRVYRSAMRQLALFDVTRCLPSLHLPVLVISGERDTTVPLATQSKLSQKIPGAQHIIIGDAGHAVIVDQPDRFNQALLHFLSGYVNSSST